MLIGLLAILVISQVLLVSEGQKRTTTVGSDSQVNGALSLYTIQRDIQTAGYGFTSSPAIVGCPISARFKWRCADRVRGHAGAGIHHARGVAPVRQRRRFDPHAVQFEDLVFGADARHSTGNRGQRPVSAGFGVDGIRAGRHGGGGHRWRAALLGLRGHGSADGHGVAARRQSSGWNTAGTPTQAYGDGSMVVNLGSVVDNRYEINNA